MIDATNVTLLPCPFCGGEAMLMAQTFSWEVHCLPCTASVSEETQPEAIAAWNTRTAAEAASKAEIAELVAELFAMTEHYVQLAGCGDCGFWNPEEEERVIAARALLAKHQTEGRGA